MDGARFEDWLASFFRARGYRVETTPEQATTAWISSWRKTSQDRGPGKTVERSVGVTAIQEVYAGKTLYGADAAMVVTNSRFTDDARRLAKSTGVVLWDRNRLRAELENQAKHPATKASLAS